jgi:hypothetical protein
MNECFLHFFNFHFKAFQLLQLSSSQEILAQNLSCIRQFTVALIDLLIVCLVDYQLSYYLISLDEKVFGCTIDVTVFT